MNQWHKNIAKWRIGEALYISVPFTWLLPNAKIIATAHQGRVVAGGPAVSLLGAPWADETPEEAPIEPILFHNPCATFTTRGCPNRCPYCIVPKVEGDFCELSSWRPAPMICDNNILESSWKHFERVIDSLRPFRAVDFNQGLDAGLFTSQHAGLLATLQHVKIRFAFDSSKDEVIVADAIQAARRANLTDISIYVLIGFDDDPENAKSRLEWVRSFNLRPNPMRFQPLDALSKDSYVAPGWTDRELKRMMRYYSRLRWFEHIPFNDFEYEPKETLDLFLAAPRNRNACDDHNPTTCGAVEPK